VFDIVEFPFKNSIPVDSPLTALKDNACVVLSIRDKKMRLKKRAQHPVLMIAPVSLYGDNNEDTFFLFSIPGYGAELINLQGIKAIQLYRLGMTMKASLILVKEINEIFSK